MKILAKVKYVGTKYHGWQKQINASSVQEEIEKVLSKILNEEINIYGSGRTDAGVHALGQTFHFETSKDVDLDRFRYSVNMLLPKDIHIISFIKVEEDFHARHSAKLKFYQYRFYTSEEDPFSQYLSAYFPVKFDVTKLKNSLALFIGKHNFSSFTSKEEDADNFVRNIYDISTHIDGYIYTINFYGDGFMRYMIRDIVGTCLAVASGKEEMSYITYRLDSDKRDITSYKAPSEGLYLIDVIY